LLSIIKDSTRFGSLGILNVQAVLISTTSLSRRIRCFQQNFDYLLPYLELPSRKCQVQNSYSPSNRIQVVMPKVATEKKKTKSSTSASSGGAKKKASAYNVFMKTELAKLKAKNPEQPHKERFKQAASAWASSKENPKNAT